MIVAELFLRDWRNISEINFRPDAAINIFLGQNAQGKTNILEAINFASLLRSRASRESELIRWGQAAAIVRIKFYKAGVSHVLAIEISADRRRRIFLDANPIRPRELLGKLNSVLFSPEDLFMFKGSPSMRRKFLDAQISQASPVYFMDLMKYTKLVELRNALLKKIRDDFAQESELNLWDEQLAFAAAKIISRRLAAVEKLNDLANYMQQKISSWKENLSVFYDMRLLDTQNDVAENFFQLLRARRSKDIQNGSTSFGPHRDDLKFFVNGRELKIFGSQGQLRTAALALKLSELQFIKDETGEYPLLLLDEVMSELDAARRELLIDFLRREKIQTLITATDRAYFPPQSFGKFFSVESGRLIDFGVPTAI
ncbi:MAG: DNA replication/repair protein RecF [Selenomonadaceae bacterium]|nr:DNA replication/repair protein RecF [Selenomonadaceae bacterium]